MSLVQRWYSARIGEVFDLRTQVFDHAQRMPLAFFTRTQTGALVSRLNNDVIGAQQAFTSTLSGVVSNVIGLVLTAAVMFSLSWQITALSLVLLPVFVLPARLPGRRPAAGDHPESYGLNASMNATMTERFNVSGALLVKLFGRLAQESGRSPTGPRGCVTSAWCRRCTRGCSSSRSPWSPRWRRRWSTAWAATRADRPAGRGHRGHPGAAAVPLYGPLTALSNVQVDVMSALVSFERVFEVLDISPMVVDKPGAVELAPGTRSIDFEDVHFSYPTAAEVSLASLEDVAMLDQAPAQPCCTGCRSRRAGGAGRAGRPVRCRQDHDQPTGAADLRRGAPARSGSAGRTSWDVTQESLHAAIGVVTQDAHLFHETIGDNLAMPDRTRPGPRCGRRWSRRRWPTWSRRCPTGWTRSATAATGCPAGRSSGWRSPGCCSRRPAS